MFSQNFFEKRLLLLEEFLNFVPIWGWNKNSLIKAAEKAKISCQEAELLFPDMFSLAQFFLDYNEKIWLENLKSENNNPSGVKAKILQALLLLFRQNYQHRDSIKALASFLVKNAHFYTILRAFYRNLNQIWYKAGDKSTDWNYYSKRILLAFVYLPTVIYWFSDKSEHFQRTEVFLEKKLNQISNISYKLGKAKDCCSLFHNLALGVIFKS
jgi:ubiquinone biosynthesis protein COQ9